MGTDGGIVLILGSGRNAVLARDWQVAPFDALVAINNAWRVRSDWTHHIYPEDFPPERLPYINSSAQRAVTHEEYVPCQNRFGGVVHAGGTMAFTAGYWALSRLRPWVMAYLGCDMVYPETGPTHFYGTGAADPLRVDPTLRSLEAKAARLFLIAATRGCYCVNLSSDPSRLVFPRAALEDLDLLLNKRLRISPQFLDDQRDMERRLGYFVESGRYWEAPEPFDCERIDAIDRCWLEAFERRAEVGLP